MILMSKIGKIPIQIPEEVKVSIEESPIGQRVTIASSKGSLACQVRKEIGVKLSEGNIIVERKDNSRLSRALHGTTRAILANLVKGVTVGFERTLVLAGVGFRARVEGRELFLSVGFSHQVKFTAPAGINFAVNEDKIIISGLDKQLVGEVADKIRKIKPPEPYKGKGIRFLEEKVKRKVGKKAVATA